MRVAMQALGGPLLRWMIASTDPFPARAVCATTTVVTIVPICMGFPMASDEVKNILSELSAIQDAKERDAASFLRARSLIGHADNDVRWQALIAVGNWIYSDRPEPVWQVVLEYGESEDEDMRVGVATVLLEHLLEFYFDDYFPRVRDRIEAGASMLKETLSMCGRFGQSDEQWAEMCRLSGRP